MKYKILSTFKKILAAITSFFLALSGTGEVPPAEPAANAVSIYDSAAADYSLDIDAANEIHDISELLFGIFFEDINFAADGGLYAEKVVNRSFEFTQVAAGDELYGWKAVNGAEVEVVTDDTKNCLNENNTNYAVITNNSDSQAGIANVGFLDGMSIESGAEYRFSVWAKGMDGYNGTINVKLCAGDNIAGNALIENVTDEWQKYELEIASSQSANSAVSLQVLIDSGKLAVDMVSLFPVDTYKGRENGMRKDLATMLEELEPKFLRFPGGCIIEGYDENTAYNWKDSIGVGSDGEPLYFNGGYGDVAARKQGMNLWTNISATDDPYPSFMTYGLGFFEYFQLAEDIGAIGVPVLNCGLFCQMRGRGPVEMYTPEFQQYIQDMLDLVEFCRGDIDSKWGKVRASLGHHEPFELKYICIGNENEGQVYFERYEAFLNAFNEAKAENPALYDGLELIYSAGAFAAHHGENYLPSYEFASDWLEANPDKTLSDFAGATDQHYYNEPEWFLKNTDYYNEENYKRDSAHMTDTIYGGGINVFLGEYAARSNTLKAALAEAAYMTGLERNGDIVKMAAYAPLFGNLTATHWSPDLIWFNNHLCTGSISYYVQKIFSINQGSKVLDYTLSGAAVEQNNLQGRVGVGTWYTAAEFDDVKITDNMSGKTLGEDNFSIDTFWWNWEKVTDGKFKVKNGKLVQSTTEMAYGNNGSVVYYGDDEWENYTYTVKATKLEGEEGFIIPFAVQDKDNCFFWNIGGWGNTVSCLQQIENGIKTNKIIGTVKPFNVETGKAYELKIAVDGRNVKCYIDGEIYVDYTAGSDAEAECYSVVSTDESGDIIVKIVNVTDRNKTLAVNVKNADIAESATVYQVVGDSLANDNILGAEEDCKMEEFELSGFPNEFNFAAPKYSVTVIRLERK
ncbi:MAG: carbohydrate binding domain-containing protein [Clostridia bacterium]|nr:carbohydrate binding domain-containing protein [Clostridia bacterium]